MGRDTTTSALAAVGAPFRALGALRHAKAFHPPGRTVAGSLDLSGPPMGVVSPQSTVTVRLSKGAGLPGGVPDILGVAVRFTLDDGRPWDLLLASSTDRTARLPVPVPARSWSGTVFSSLTPFAVGDTLWWTRATCRAPSESAAVPTTPVHLSLDHACGLAPFRPVAEIVTDTRVMADLDADPVRNLPAGVAMAPRWLARVRGAAYDNSRAGRGLSRASGTP